MSEGSAIWSFCKFALKSRKAAKLWQVSNELTDTALCIQLSHLFEMEKQKMLDALICTSPIRLDPDLKKT